MNEGLKHLLQCCEAKKIDVQSNKGVVIPLYSFVDKLLRSLKDYVKNTVEATWAEHVVVENSGRGIANVVGSWQVHASKSLECQLLATLLNQTQTSKLSEFLKLRKYTMKVGGGSMLDDISLYHEDVIGILHNVYKTAQIKKTITKGIKKLFISYKMASPKIYSCVFIQYALSFHDDFYQQEHQQAQLTKKHPQVDEDHSIFQSTIHEDNGLYRKVSSIGVAKAQIYKVIERRFMESNQQDKSNFQSNITSQKVIHQLNKSKQTPPPEVRQVREVYETGSKNSGLGNFSPPRYTSSYFYEQTPYSSSDKKRTEYSPQGRSQFKLHRIEEAEQSPKQNKMGKEKQGGYQTWIKMVDSNRQFKERMLKSRACEEKKESINFVNESVVKQCPKWS